ncbi:MULTISPECIES: CHAT domain-containing protein [Leptolyngbya]|uniref:CHAT domain-containing protein n=1 Tax=Leptolyngbya TaxID=47251 RepID=UPI001683B570|nr:CHAT domain-containing tetratricopeptide repeat protein [Leptolyngbya sp. FACHB-1624]MBD1859642.1 CHAT domain-containing protein [Leptolyngbya sp. FACHB-1624]
MDEQRIQAYVELIGKLLECPGGQEGEILQQHEELVDQGLLMVMGAMSQHLQENGQPDAAAFLDNLRGQLEKVLGESVQAEVESTSGQDAAQFVLEILQCVADHSGNPQQVYPFFQANLVRLNEELLQVFPLVVARVLEGKSSEQQWSISADAVNFANLIAQFPLGNRWLNLELSIAAYTCAVQIFTFKKFPEQWATTQNNLANAYSDRIVGDRAENIELAIFHYQQALEVRTRQAFPVDWAGTQNNLANAYSDRIVGDRAENIELAIFHYQQALEVRTRQAFPEQWATTQNNLATAYSDRIVGDRAENIELAIFHYQQALEVYTRQAFPVDWAMTQNNLANAYRDRIVGDRAENIELAIFHYQQALEVRTRQAFPVDWAMTQNNLATAYSDRIVGDRAENIELAIFHYQQALEVRTRQAFPEQWATTQNNLATAYRDRIVGDRAENIELAIFHYQQALEIRTISALPTACFQTSRNLGNLHFTAGNWQPAAEAYRLAIQANDRLRSWGAHEDRRQEILEEAARVYMNLVQAYVNLKQYDNAIETVERSRSRRLAELMASNDLYQNGEIPAELQTYLQQYETLQTEIDQLSPALVPALADTRNRAALDSLTEEIRSLETKKQKVRQQISRLDPVSAGLLQLTPPSIDSFAPLITNSSIALLSFYITNNGTYIFVLRQTANGELETTCHTLPDQTLETLNIWLLQNWLIPYTQNYATWCNAFPTLLDELSDRLDLNTLISQHLQNIDELILIPHLLLHQIPFAALKLPTGELLSDRFTLRQIPNTQVLKFCVDRPALTPTDHSTVENATDDLPCTPFEGQVIADLLNIQSDRRLQGSRQARVQNYRTLIQNTHGILSSHHAQSRLDAPLESHLLLADGKITLGQLLSPAWRFPNLADVFLSCCETGLSYTASITDEPLNLATGFLCAGARNVVSTLWAVDDLATSIFTIRYYHHRQTHNRPIALYHTQQDLRNLTGADLKRDYYDQLNSVLDRQYNQAAAERDRLKSNPSLKEDHKHWSAIATKIDSTQRRLKQLCKKDHPFAHPVYWAGFISQGMS